MIVPDQRTNEPILVEKWGLITNRDCSHGALISSLKKVILIYNSDFLNKKG